MRLVAVDPVGRLILDRLTTIHPAVAEDSGPIVLATGRAGSAVAARSASNSGPELLVISLEPARLRVAGPGAGCFRCFAAAGELDAHYDRVGDPPVGFLPHQLTMAARIALAVLDGGGADVRIVELFDNSQRTESLACDHLAVV